MAPGVPRRRIDDKNDPARAHCPDILLGPWYLFRHGDSDRRERRQHFFSCEAHGCSGSRDWFIDNQRFDRNSHDHHLGGRDGYNVSDHDVYFNDFERFYFHDVRCLDLYDNRQLPFDYHIWKFDNDQHFQFAFDNDGQFKF
jgi:hypothetical protein